MRILVVDDSEVDRQVLEATLRSLGFDHITTAKNGEEALLALEDEEFHVVFTDIEMPDMNGLLLLEKIRTSLWQHNLPVFLVSSLINADAGKKEIAYIRFEAKQFGVTELLSKPVNPEVVREQLLAANLL